MSLRKDAEYMTNQEYEPKVPDEDIILKQAIRQIKHGKSTGSTKLDIKAMKEMREPEEDER